MPWLFSSKASLRWLRAGWLLCCPGTFSLWQCCQSTGVFFEDLAAIVCPNDPPRSRRAFSVQGFFSGFGKTGMGLVAGSVGCGVAYIFEGGTVMTGYLEQELCSPGLRSDSPSI